MDPTRLIEFYTNAFYISTAVAVVGAIVTGVIFVRMDIWKIIGDLTGRTQRREIEAIKYDQNRTDSLVDSGGLAEPVKAPKRHSGRTGMFRMAGNQARSVNASAASLNPDTMPLDQSRSGETEAYADIHFRITESTVVIHTTEKITL